MKLWHIDLQLASDISEYDSRSASIINLLGDAEKWHLSVLQLGPSGLVGMHPAQSEQLQIVMSGSGTVRVGGGPINEVGPLTCVLWEEGEAHETCAGAEGLIALVVEGEGLSQGLKPDAAPE